ncbi:Uncharacterized protein TCM_024311 [Theobroma cacao]|uniref:Reverse transcriptase domain-containing protein n=1 Tax=Theobroma cacao TaxID=3641 RepID=A0A061EX19_THECC|nr:Uncharacterized protein TCM_024311 [Theobroma cacao]
MVFEHSNNERTSVFMALEDEAHGMTSTCGFGNVYAPNDEQERVAFWKNRQDGLLFKVDFDNEFDSVSWDFLDLVLRMMGLRQGYPLSQLLFNLVVEVFSALMYRAVNHQLIKGLEPNGILPSLGNPSKASGIWKNITMPLSGAYDFSFFVVDEMVVKKVGSLEDFGNWNGDEGTWNIEVKWPNLNASITYLTRLLNEGTTLAKSKTNKNVVIWSKLLVGFLKFNIDGSSRGCLEDSGIKGILRNKFRDMIVLFSKAIGIFYSNKVELLAVSEAAIMSLVKQTCNVLAKVDRWQINHVPRSSNNEADFSAKERVLRPSNLLSISDFTAIQEIDQNIKQV